MKKKKIKEELTEVKELLKHVICQVQNMQSRIDQLDQDSMLWCPNMMTVQADRVSAVDLSEVVWVNCKESIKDNTILTKNDLEYQENRKKTQGSETKL